MLHGLYPDTQQNNCSLNVADLLNDSLEPFLQAKAC